MNHVVMVREARAKALSMANFPHSQGSCVFPHRGLWGAHERLDQLPAAQRPGAHDGGGQAGEQRCGDVAAARDGRRRGACKATRSEAQPEAKREQQGVLIVEGGNSALRPAQVDKSAETDIAG